MLSRYQYGVPASFTWQANPAPHLELTREQQLQYKMQTSFRASGPETIGTYLERLEYRVRFYRFFFLPPLYIALPFFLARLREWRFAWVALTLVLFALGVNFYPFFEVHYLGALTCLFVLVSVIGLERLSALNAEAARLIVFLCLAQFLFFYGRSFFDHPAPDRRVAVKQQLALAPGKQLVFVRYSPQHIFQNEWVYNAADIDQRAGRVGAGSRRLTRTRNCCDTTGPHGLAAGCGRYASHTQSLSRQEPPKPAAPPPPRAPNASPPLRFEQVK